jgi:hypothetical protein
VEFADQAKYHQDLQQNSKWQKLLQSSAVMNRTHPFPAVRALEILKWEQSEQYQRLRSALVNGNLSDASPFDESLYSVENDNYASDS